MRSDDRHVCGDRCVCPVHRTPLMFHERSLIHACTDPDCVHAHGMKFVLVPGTISSRRSGHRNYVSVGELEKLYKLHRDEYVVYKDMWRQELLDSGCVFLRPSFYGVYGRPYVHWWPK